MNLSHLTRLDGVSSVALGPLAISVWDRTPKLDEARAMADVWGNVAKANPGVMILAVIGTKCAVPDNTVRDLLTREVKRIMKQLTMVANVVEGAGFGAAALRGAVTGMTLIIQPSYPVKTFGTVIDAAEFLSKGGVVGAADVNEAVRIMRASPSTPP